MELVQKWIFRSTEKSKTEQNCMYIWEFSIWLRLQLNTIGKEWVSRNGLENKWFGSNQLSLFKKLHSTLYHTYQQILGGFKNSAKIELEHIWRKYFKISWCLYYSGFLILTEPVKKKTLINLGRTINLWAEDNNLNG